MREQRNVINDILPVYYSKYSRKGNAAYVYFDSRTYRGLKGGVTISPRCGALTQREVLRQIVLVPISQTNWIQHLEWRSEIHGPTLIPVARAGS